MMLYNKKSRIFPAYKGKTENSVKSWAVMPSSHFVKKGGIAYGMEMSIKVQSKFTPNF